jgi:hypothetical protein
VSITESADGKEIYTSRAAPTVSSIAQLAPPPVEEEEEEAEDLAVPVNPGTVCRHRGCRVTFVSDDVNRVGDGEGTVCTYHPSAVSANINF